MIIDVSININYYKKSVSNKNWNNPILTQIEYLSGHKKSETIFCRKNKGHKKRAKTPLFHIS